MEFIDTALRNELIVHLVAPVCGGIGGLALAMLILNLIDHACRKWEGLH